MNMVRWGMEDESSIEAWVRIARAHSAVLTRVEAQLKAQDLPPLAWYDVLWELERTGTPLRPRDIESRLLLAQYNLSRLLDRLEAAGFVLRAPARDDGRGRLIDVTEAGRATRRRMWPVYRAAVNDMIGTRLRPSEAKLLGVLLAKLQA